MAPSLIGLGAEVKIAGLKKTRKVLLEDFFKGPGITMLGNGEILVEIRYQRFRQRQGRHI
jgi:CO/xanthine dehydrogenase FAD-binding subunit